MSETLDIEKYAQMLIHGTRISIILYACILLLLGVVYIVKVPDYNCEGGINLHPGCILFICGLMLYHIKYHFKNKYKLSDMLSLVPAIFMLWIAVYMTGYGFASLDGGGYLNSVLVSVYVLFFDTLQFLHIAFLLSMAVSITMSAHPGKKITGGQA